MRATHIIIAALAGLLLASPPLAVGLGGLLAPQEDALAQYRERLQALAVADPEAHVELAAWLESVGLENQALDHLEQAIALDPDHATAREKLGYVLRKGRWTATESTRRTDLDEVEMGRLPADVEAIVDLTTSEDPRERELAYERLNGILEEEAAWLERSLTDPDAPGHAEARDLVALEGLPVLPGALLEDPGAHAEMLAVAVRRHVQANYTLPLLRHFTRRRDEQLRGHERDGKKVRSVLPIAESSKGQKEREALLARVEEARGAALAAIYDSESYYKTEDGVVFGQKLVDEKVASLREAWQPVDERARSDLRLLLQVSEADAVKALDRLARDRDVLGETNTFLTSLGGSSAEPGKRPAAFVRAALAHRAGRIDLAATFLEGLSAWERHLMERLRDIRALEANAALAASEPETGVAPKANELRQSSILNDYRVMLGRHAVELNPQLVECARGHSEEMSRLGYFGHDSPTPGRESPSDRAKLAGYDDGVSENIHMTGGIATPEGAHDGWYRSPPHHRNMVSDAWWCIGVGHHGAYFTQNFGSRKLVAR